MAELSKYDTAKTYYFPLVDFGATDFEATPVTHAAGDTQRSLDGGAFANTTNAFAHEGNGIYSISVTAAEHQAARIVVTIVDQTSPKAWEDQAILIQTYGHASADMAFDLDSATVDVGKIGGVEQSATDLKDFADTGYDPATHKVAEVATLTGHTAQTGDSYAVVNHADHGNAKLVRSTTPTNKLDVSATGEAGLDFNNIKDAAGAHTLTNITVPTTMDVTNPVNATSASIQDIGAAIRSGRKIWYVDSASGSDANDGKSLSKAKQTWAAVAALAGNGDAIHAVGSFAGIVTLAALTGVDIYGTKGGTSFTHTSNTITLGDKCGVHDCDVTSTGAVHVAIYASGKTQPTVHNCHITATARGIQFVTCDWCRVTDCDFDVAEYGVYATNAGTDADSSLLVRGCRFDLSGWAGCDAIAVDAENYLNRIEDCDFRVTSTIDNAANNVACVKIPADKYGLVKNCQGHAYTTAVATHAYAINSAGNTIVDGGQFTSAASGAGDAYDLRQTAGTLVRDGVQYTTSTGTISDAPGLEDIKAKTDSLNFTGDDVKATLDSETVKLASDGLDSVATTEPAGVASDFREMLVQTWQRLFKKSTMTATEVKTYKDDDITVATTQVVSDVGGTQTQGKAT